MSLVQPERLDLALEIKSPPAALVTPVCLNVRVIPVRTCRQMRRTVAPVEMPVGPMSIAVVVYVFVTLATLTVVVLARTCKLMQAVVALVVMLAQLARRVALVSVRTSTVAIPTIVARVVMFVMLAQVSIGVVADIVPMYPMTIITAVPVVMLVLHLSIVITMLVCAISVTRDAQHPAYVSLAPATRYLTRIRANAAARTIGHTVLRILFVATCNTAPTGQQMQVYLTAVLAVMSARQVHMRILVVLGYVLTLCIATITVALAGMSVALARVA